MKALITATGQFGPFTSIETLSDRYSCDGAEYQFEVIGEATIGDFVAPPPPLEGLKAAKNAEINAARLAANFTTFAHAGKTIACDQLSRSDIDGTNGFVSLYGALPPGWPGGWKAVDNTYVTIATVDAWKSFYASLFAAGNNNFAKAQTLKATLAAATTAEQIAAVQWST